MNSPLRILIAPLDWGLGHATRCIPIISKLLAQGHLVTFAGNQTTNSLIQKTFPDIEFLFLKGYEISYSRKRFLFAPRIFLQIPKILKRIKEEHIWLEHLLQTESFDLIISDNRYGLYNNRVPCIIMTHQLTVLTGFGHKVDSTLRRLHYRFLKKFTQCWVVDFKAGEGIAGKLSHPGSLPPKTTYIGLLSQFSIIDNTNAKPATSNTDQPQILVLLSGPEPQRGILEKELIKQISGLSYKYRFVVVSGKSKNLPTAFDQESIVYFPMLSANELFPYFKHSDLVVCRSGYSSIMDLTYFHKKALFIPTPGQTEQEYLAKFLSGKGFGIKMNQNQINLEKGILKALELQYPPIIQETEDLLEEVLHQALKRER